MKPITLEKLRDYYNMPYARPRDVSNMAYINAMLKIEEYKLKLSSRK